MDAATMVATILTELKNPAIGSQVYGYINVAQEWLNEMGYWHHLTSKLPYQFRFLAPVTTGTVTATNGSTAITGSGTAWDATMVNQVIQVNGTDEHYYITAVGSATSLTINVAFNGVTGPGLLYSIDYVNYDLPSTISLRKIKSLVIQNPYAKLVYIDQRRRDEMSPNILGFRSQPWGYLDWGKSTIQPYPSTDANYVATLRFQQKPTAVTGTQIVFDFPDDMHQTIFKLALAQGWKFMDDDQANDVMTEGLQMAQQAFDGQKKTGDNQIKLRRFDEYFDKSVFGLRLGARING